MKFRLCSILFIVLLYKNCECVKKRYYPKYHLAPPRGWMNDPNGFCIFGDEYHLFYQYNPYSSQEPGIAHWGHAKSHDLVHWEHLPIAMAPDREYDRDGVFSGSAIVENDTMYLFYTGNVNHRGQNPDHEQHQALACSRDGVTVKKYEENPIIEGANRQPNFRDPKVWKHDGKYYMVLGNSYENDTLGRVLLYSSEDKYNWKEISILDQSDGSLGYMWECPDFFELDGHFVLLFSPQGIEPDGYRYNNLYQVGYFVGDYDYKTNKFTRLTDFVELDAGHDFYATQTLEDKDGKRIMVAWADMWEQDYPERNDGFTGQMTTPRILCLDENLKLIQKPIPQIDNAVGRKLYSGKSPGNKAVKLENKAAKIHIRAPGDQDFTFILEADQKPAVTVRFDYEEKLVTLNRGGDDGKRSAKFKPDNSLDLIILIDSSSIELFINHGVLTFTSRMFEDGDLSIRIGEKSVVNDMTVYCMRQTVPNPPKI